MSSLRVFLNFGQQRYCVGALDFVRDRNQYVFEYDTEFPTRKLAISPLNLPLDNRVYYAERALHPADSLQGIHGVFADSLPDAWGSKAMLIWFKKRQIFEPTVLEKLAWIGTRGMGALEYEPCLEASETIHHAFDVRELRANAIGIIEGSAKEVSDELSIIGGSAGGMRAKYLVGMTEDKQFIYGAEKMTSSSHRACVLKVSLEAKEDYQQIEYVYSLMAQEAGIDIPATYLVAVGGGYYYAIERFDRWGPYCENKKHMHSLAGLLGVRFGEVLIDYETALNMTLQLTRDHRCVVELFRRMVFNYLGHNCDDHSKNMSFLMDEKGKWLLAPAYDMTFSRSRSNVHLMTLRGQVETPAKQEFYALANTFRIKKSLVDDIFEQVIVALEQWPTLAKDVDISSDRIQYINQFVKQNIARL